MLFAVELCLLTVCCLIIGRVNSILEQVNEKVKWSLVLKIANLDDKFQIS